MNCTADAINVVLTKTIKATLINFLREYALKRGSILSSFRYILKGEKQLLIKKEESNDEYHADETRTAYSTCFRR